MSVVSAASPTTDRVRVLGRELEYKWVVAAVFTSALFLDILDTSIVNVALPKLASDFRSDAVEWVVLGYTLSLAVWIPVSGWLGDRFGTKRVFMGALVLFVLGSALCGAAQTIDQLIAFRVFQGVGGGMLTPVGTAMLFRSFPPAERARAATFMMIPTLAAPALGPILGGLIVTHIGWRWIFYVNVPVGFVALAFGFLYLREHREPTAGRFDLLGFVFSGGGLALVVYALSEGPRAGWTSSTVLGSAAAGGVLFAMLVWWELRTPQPMLDLRLIGDRMFRACNLVSAFSTASFLGLIFILPLYLQTLRGFDAFHSGLTTFPQAFGIMLSSQFAGRLYRTVGPRRLMAGGLLWAAVTIATFVTLDLHTSLWLIRIMIFVRGLGMGFAFVPMQAASYAKIRPQDNGRASSIFSTQRQMAASVGIALLATVVASYTPLGQQVTDTDSALTGFHLAFLASGAFALAGAAVAWFFVHDEDAAATMVVRPAR